MVRRIAGTILGCLAAIAIVTLSEALDQRIWPAGRVDMDDAAAVAALIARLPLAALIAVTLGWFVGALVGGVIGASVARWRPAAWIAATFVLVGSIVNLATIHHPLWMQVAGIALPILAAPLATRTARI